MVSEQFDNEVHLKQFRVAHFKVLHPGQERL
jgi:hypothetical protein